MPVGLVAKLSEIFVNSSFDFNEVFGRFNYYSNVDFSKTLSSREILTVPDVFRGAIYTLVSDSPCQCALTLDIIVPHSFGSMLTEKEVHTLDEWNKLLEQTFKLDAYERRHLSDYTCERLFFSSVLGLPINHADCGFFVDGLRFNFNFLIYEKISLISLMGRLYYLKFSSPYSHLDYINEDHSYHFDIGGSALYYLPDDSIKQILTRGHHLVLGVG